MTTTNKELAVVPSTPEPQALATRGNVTFAPRTFEEAVKFSKIAASTDLVPAQYRNKPEQIFLAIQMGAELGLSPMQAIQNIAVINNRPCLWGDAVLALVQGHQAYESHEEWIEGEGQQRTAFCKIKRRGQKEHIAKFSMADAVKAGLTSKNNTPWQTYPDRMLQMRARGFALRDKFADALRGIGVVEEVQDYPQTVTAEPAPQATPTEDPEKTLREEADQLFQKLYPEMNAAKRQMKIGQYQGRVSELISKIKEAAGCPVNGSSSQAAGSHTSGPADASQSSAHSAKNGQQRSSATSESRSATSDTQERATHRSASNAQPSSDQTATTARSTKGSDNIHGLDITDDDLPNFEDSPQREAAPTPTSPTTRSAPASGKAWSF